MGVPIIAFVKGVGAMLRNVAKEKAKCDWSVVVAATAKVAEYSTAPMKAASDASACGMSLECGRGCEGVRAVGRVGYESSRCGPA